MDIYGKTDVGKVRQLNQDTFIFEKLNYKLGFAFVCDGMGGLSYGNVASQLATRILFEGLCSNLGDCVNSNEIEILLKTCFQNANQAILKYASSDKNLFGMGTTVVGAIISNYVLHIFNIGDSRAYLFNNLGLKQLTVDHSYVQTLVDCGRITQHEAKFHPRKNEITKALGISTKIDFDFYTQTVEKNDVILLCSDGLTNACDEFEIEQILKLKKNMKQSSIKLVNCANEKGGFDNITVVLLKI